MIPIKVEMTGAGQTGSRASSKHANRVKLAKKVSIVFIAVVLVVLGGALYMIEKNTSASDTSLRQAVFVTTGQVYFGYVANADTPMVKIDEAYYLNGASSIMPGKTPQDKISLIKMGSEIYKPMNSVLINRDQIIAIQDISADSQINVAIAGSLKSN